MCLIDWIGKRLILRQSAIKTWKIDFIYSEILHLSKWNTLFHIFRCLKVNRIDLFLHRISFYKKSCLDSGSALLLNFAARCFNIGWFGSSAFLHWKQSKLIQEMLCSTKNGNLRWNLFSQKYSPISSLKQVFLWWWFRVNVKNLLLVPVCPLATWNDTVGVFFWWPFLRQTWNILGVCWLVAL